MNPFFQTQLIIKGWGDSFYTALLNSTKMLWAYYVIKAFIDDCNNSFVSFCSQTAYNGINLIFHQQAMIVRWCHARYSSGWLEFCIGVISIFICTIKLGNADLGSETNMVPSESNKVVLLWVKYILRRSVSRTPTTPKMELFWN